MPIYVYKCPVCDEQFERQQGFNDKPLETCPQGHAGVKRVYTPAGIVFKGSGWYVTDNRNGGTGSNGKSSAKSASKSETKAEATSET